MASKSSAQNILSSFKSSSNAPPIQIPSSGNISGLPFREASGSISTPTTTASIAREWDVQSMGSDGLPAGPGINSGSPGIAQGTSLEYLRDLVQKRIITLTYMRNVHDGRSHWFHTIVMSRSDLERVFNNTAMKKRTTRFVILGMSLANLFEIIQPQDLLRGLLNVLNEYEQAKEPDDKPRMTQRLFRSRIAKRQAGGMNDYAISYVDSADTSYLSTPHVPFALDYHQALLSLLDVLSEVYNKISKILGPSPLTQAGQHMAGPLGLLPPHPGVSYLFDGNGNTIPSADSESSLWGIANGAGGGAASTMFTLGSPPPTWTPALADGVTKVDGKLKKILAMLLKELDTFARNSIKDELASLDPLLRNVAITEDSREQYDFEGGMD